MNLQTITQKHLVILHSSTEIPFAPWGYNCMLREGAFKTEENSINH